MNKFPLYRLLLLAALIAFSVGCKSSKAHSDSTSTAGAIDVTNSAQPGGAAAHSHDTSHAHSSAEPFPPNSTTGPADAELNYRTHKVEKGDTLYAIAREHGTTVANIQNANPGVDPRALRIGQEIIVPTTGK